MHKVRVTLAHPLIDRDAERLRLPVGQAYNAGTEVVLEAEMVPALAASGYLAHDARDPRAVPKLMRRDTSLDDVPLGAAPAREDDDSDKVKAEAEALRAAEAPSSLHAEPSSGSGQPDATGGTKAQRSSATKAAADAARG